ncbi:MAG: hypothetical protein DMD67_13395 [Gemmatimonadetes bacterium]|nr:MAG: hypothetical protein DMD67_13395 [Gemmatimonadota bacterium]
MLAADAAPDKRAIITARIAQQVRRYNGRTVRQYNLVVNLGYAAFDGSEQSEGARGPGGATASIEELLQQAVADRVAARRSRA